MSKENIYYNFLLLEKKWREKWSEIHKGESHQLSVSKYHHKSEKKNDLFVLEMFMYPSGKLHMGHVRNYTIGDVIVRYRLSQGHAVLHNTGFDAFGLPAENAARDNGLSPKLWTETNINFMLEQLKQMSFLYNWDRTISTCNLSYYRHQQSLFRLLYRMGLIFRKQANVNWDPVEQCVLANEQVINGAGWRSGAKVETRLMDQWFLRITDYAEELLQNLDKLDQWPERIRTMQRNWIGKEESWQYNDSVSSQKDLELAIEYAGTIGKIKKIIVPESIASCKSDVPIEIRYEISNLEFVFASIYKADSKLTKVTRYNIRDWCISRQRYWGCPIPIIYCNDCGIVLEENTIELPEYELCNNQSPNGNPLASCEDWVKTSCPNCSNPARRETDTMDTFFDSSWYFLRFISQPDDKPFDSNEVSSIIPVDCYIGGIEHAVLHLLYARFFTKALRDAGLISIDEPFSQLINQGMIHHPVYIASSGNYLYPSEIINKSGKIVDKEGIDVSVLPPEKMSKSKKNIVDPHEVVSTYGVDSMRVFILSDVPVERDMIWSEEGLTGSWKMINKIYRLSKSFRNIIRESWSEIPILHKIFSDHHSYAEELVKEANISIQEIFDQISGEDRAISIFNEMSNYYDQRSFNLVIAKLHKLVRILTEDLTRDHQKLSLISGFIALIISSYPVIPHLAEELWQEVGGIGYACLLEWPKAKSAGSKLHHITVQVNGKNKGSFTPDPSSSKEDIIATARKLISKSNKLFESEKVIFVPNKVVNFVIKLDQNDK